MQYDELVKENARLQAEVEVEKKNAINLWHRIDTIIEEKRAMQSELTKARELLVQWVIQSPAHLERLISETKAALGDVKKAGDKCGRCGETTACGKMLCEACCYEPMQEANQSAPADKGRAVTYSSTQATNCAGCGKYKHTPLRVDGMGGYVCLTCIDERLEELLDAEQPAPVAVVIPEKYDDVLLPFLSLMRAELHANAHKGDRPGWLQMDRKTAVLEVFYHMGKLHQAVHRDEAEAIKEYAADVANMCMMLTDVCGYLNSEPKP